MKFLTLSSISVLALSFVLMTSCRKTPFVEPAMVHIPGGILKRSSEKSIKSVQIRSFSMSKYPVTVGEYRSYCEDNGTEMPSGIGYKVDWSDLDHPIVFVSWSDAKGYCAWLSKKTGKAYDLPTEAQWEYATRGGLEGKEYPWGDKWDGSKCANSVSPNNLPLVLNRDRQSTSPGTVKVGSYPPNGYGLYDVVGNVSCWCRDQYSSVANLSADYAVRGSSWGSNDPVTFRCAYTGTHIPGFISDDNIGFRVVVR